MLAPFLISAVCVVVGFLFVLFAFVNPPWFLQPIFDVNLFYFLGYRTQKLIIGAFFIVVPPLVLLGLGDHLGW
jgi:hypothetical protein